MSWYLDSNFNGANMSGAGVTIINGQPALSITPDPRRGNEVLWFHFCVWRLCPDSPSLILLLRHVDNLLGGGNGANLQPVVRVDGKEWKRLDRGCPVKHSDGTVDVYWKLPDASAMIEVAFCYPYTFHEMVTLLGRVPLRLQVIGTSENGRPLWRIDNGPGELNSSRPGCFLIARQHSGETPGSWVLEGFLEQIASMGDQAPLTWAIPFGDLDGVLDGQYGKDRHPIDYNRAWPGVDGVSRRHEVLCYVRDFNRWRQRCSPRLVIDLHAPGAGERDGVYCFPPWDHPDQMDPRVMNWLTKIHRILGDYASSQNRFIRIANYPSRWPRDNYSTFSRWAAKENVPAISMEVSYQGNGDYTFTIEDYKEIGRRLATVLALKDSE